jgi:hypothetical protein
LGFNRENEFGFDAFLSYSHHDSQAVRSLFSRLQERSVSAWFAEQQIDVGDSITSKIQEGLSASRFLVVCLSRNFKRSTWCSAELGTQLAKEMREHTARVLPVKVDDCSDEDIPEFLYDKFAVDIRSEEGFARLVRKIKEPLEPAADKGVNSRAGRGTAATTDSIPALEADIEAAVQLFFPHPISRTFFNVIQQSERDARFDAVKVCVEIIVGYLMALSIADLTSQRELIEVRPLLEDLRGKGVTERIELLFKAVSARVEDSTPSFFPHLGEWALDEEKQPTSQFLDLMQLALSLNVGSGKESWSRTEGLLRRLLSGLAWVRLYRCIEVCDPERSRQNLVQGRYKSLIGVVRGFLSEPFYWAVSPAAMIEAGCYVMDPDGTELLRLSPFLWSRSSISRTKDDSGRPDLWIFRELHGDRLALVDASGSGEKIEVPVDACSLAAGRAGGRVVKIRVLDESAVGNSEYASPDPLDGKDVADALEHGSELEYQAENEELGIPEDLDSALLRVQRDLLSLSSASQGTDRYLVLLDGTGENFLATLERFPSHAEALQEVAVEWLRHIDEALATHPPDEVKWVLWSRRRKVEERLEDGLGSFSRSQSLFMSSNRNVLDSAFAVAESDGIDLEHGITMLLSRDDLDESDGVDWLLKNGFQSCAAILDATAAHGLREEVLEVLWRRFARIFLYYGALFWDLAKYMLNVDPGRWRVPLFNLRKALERDLPVNDVQDLLESFEEKDRKIVAAFLSIHPRSTCREIGRSFLPPSDRWEIFLAPATHLLIAQELVEQCCTDCPPGYIKSLFLLLRPRLRSAGNPIALSHSFEIIRVFYERPFFLETSFFRALVTLHKELEVRAEGVPEMEEVCRRFDIYFEEFRKKIQARDQGVMEIRFIPLPVQRKLARDGYFAEFFICNARDPIALEAVPHVFRRGDVIKFFKSSLINKAALYRLAQDKLVMQDFAIRAALCRNPKADPRQIRKFMPLLGVNEFRLIMEDKNVSGYARSFAKQLFEVKGS